MSQTDFQNGISFETCFTISFVRINKRLIVKLARYQINRHESKQIFLYF